MKEHRTLYMEIYDYFKEIIENGFLKEGEKLPSIRACSLEKNVSKTTVEQAYMCLCDDGYILPKSQSGYYVAHRLHVENNNSVVKENRVKTNEIKYDFASSGVDAESFNMDIWRRYVKSALRHSDELLFYGESQGEYELRCEIAKYASKTRNCVCNENNIVIGAGVGTLLSILCPLIKNQKTVAFEDLSYKQGITIFKDYGYSVTTDKKNSNILYVSPSYSSNCGDTMNIGERFQLTEYANKNHKLIIEDDYGSEFRYFNRPTPSLQSLSGGENVVYLGTFSKLLLPSIRISFMILPKSLTEEYEKRKDLYNQTVSKVDQIALCSYIRDGNLNSQIRKSKKLYAQKSKNLEEILKEEFKNNIEIIKTDSPLFVRCNIKCEMSTDEFIERALDNGIALIKGGNCENSAEIAFSVSSVPIEKFKEAAKIIKKLAKVSY